MVVSNLNVCQLQFVQDMFLSMQILYFSEVLGLMCSLQVADVIRTGITETNVPHYLRIQTATVTPLFKSSYLPAKI